MAVTAAKMLKNDRAATVAIIKFKQKPIVIKRYNPKKWHKYLSRGIRRSKALKSWKASQVLSSKNIPTLTSIAVIEDKLLFFKMSSFFISSFVEGISADKFFGNLNISAEEKSSTALRIIKSIKNLHEKGIFHGDLKSKNIIIWPDDIYLIDLDGVTCKRLVFNKKKKIIKDLQTLQYSWRTSKENSEIFLKACQQSFDAIFYKKLIAHFEDYQKKKARKAKKQDRYNLSTMFLNFIFISIRG